MHTFHSWTKKGWWKIVSLEGKRNDYLNVGIVTNAQFGSLRNFKVETIEADRCISGFLSIERQGLGGTYKCLFWIVGFWGLILAFLLNCWFYCIVCVATVAMLWAVGYWCFPSQQYRFILKARDKDVFELCPVPVFLVLFKWSALSCLCSKWFRR